MKKKILTLLVLCSAILVINNTQVFTASAQVSSEFMESINVSVNCTTADVYTYSMVMCGDTSLVHFPAGIDMNRVELESATATVLSFSTMQSFLIYVFNTTNLNTARSLADAVKPSIETGFDTSFTFSSIGTGEGYVNVTYTGPGKTSLPNYVGWLMQRCLASDMGGFSLTFVSMVNKINAVVFVNAYKQSGGFDWMYSMGTSYSTSIPTGTGNHKIDILDLLNVNSLAPSSYAYSEDMYTSMVMLTISSNTPVSYVSCEPGLMSPQTGQLKGWVNTPIPGTYFTAYFTFGDDSSPVNKLSYTFNGTVIPEFTALTLIVMFMLAAIIVLIAKRKLKISKLP